MRCKIERKLVGNVNGILEMYAYYDFSYYFDSSVEFWEHLLNVHHECCHFSSLNVQIHKLYIRETEKFGHYTLGISLEKYPFEIIIISN